MEYVQTSNAMVHHLATIEATVAVSKLHAIVMQALVDLTVQSTLKVRNHMFFQNLGIALKFHKIISCQEQLLK